MRDKKNDIDETTKVADYFRNHEGLLVATISATITVITLIISILAFFYQKIILQEYNVPLDIINTLNHGNLFYYVLMSMIFFAVNPLIQSKMTRTFLQNYRKRALDELFSIDLRDEENNKHREAFKRALKKNKREHTKDLFLSLLAVFL